MFFWMIGLVGCVETTRIAFLCMRFFNYILTGDDCPFDVINHLRNLAFRILKVDFRVI